MNIVNMLGILVGITDDWRDKKILARSCGDLTSVLALYSMSIWDAYI